MGFLILTVLFVIFWVLFFCVILFVLCNSRHSRHLVDKADIIETTQPAVRVVPTYPPYPVVALHPQPQPYAVSPMSKFSLTQPTGDYKNTPDPVLKTNLPAPAAGFRSVLTDGDYPPATSGTTPCPTTSSGDPRMTAAPYSRTGPSTCPVEEDPPSYFEVVCQSSVQSPY